MASDIMRAITAMMQTPVIVLLLCMMAVSVILIGSFLVEYLTEHRQLRENIPDLIEKINAASFDEIEGIIDDSMILTRQKEALRRVLKAGDMDRVSREALAGQLLFDEEEHYRGYLKWPEVITKVAPMFGLLGTLIPLGPGLIALGEGRTDLLSQSLLIAFDTTASGVMTAAVTFVILYIRKSWYRRYAQGLESMMEVIVDKMEERYSEEADYAEE